MSYGGTHGGGGGRHATLPNLDGIMAIMFRVGYNIYYPKFDQDKNGVDLNTYEGYFLNSFIGLYNENFKLKIFFLFMMLFRARNII